MDKQMSLNSSYQKPIKPLSHFHCLAIIYPMYLSLCHEAKKALEISSTLRDAAASSTKPHCLTFFANKLSSSSGNTIIKDSSHFLRVDMLNT